MSHAQCLGMDEPVTDVLVEWRSILGDHVVYPSASRTALVVAGDGRRFVLKQVADLADLGERRLRLVSEYRVVLHLWTHGLPVVLPVLTDSGRLYANAAETDADYVLLPEVPTDEDDGTGLHPLATYTDIGVRLRQLHDALASYPYEVPSWTIDLVPRTFDEALPDVLPGLARTDLERLKPVIEEHRGTLTAAMSALPTQRIHGDFHAENVLVRQGVVAALIDIDHLPIGPRIYDLAYFLANQVAWSDPQLLTERTGALLTAAQNLLTGYRSVGSLTSREADAVVPATLAVQLQLIGWHLTQPGLDGASLHLHGFHWIAEHFEQLCRTTG